MRIISEEIIKSYPLGYVAQEYEMDMSGNTVNESSGLVIDTEKHVVIESYMADMERMRLLRECIENQDTIENRLGKKIKANNNGRCTVCIIGRTPAEEVEYDVVRVTDYYNYIDQLTLEELLLENELGGIDIIGNIAVENDKVTVSSLTGTIEYGVVSTELREATEKIKEFKHIWSIKNAKLDAIGCVRLWINSKGIVFRADKFGNDIILDGKDIIGVEATAIEKHGEKIGTTITIGDGIDIYNTGKKVEKGNSNTGVVMMNKLCSIIVSNEEQLEQVKTAFIVTGSIKLKNEK